MNLRILIITLIVFVCTGLTGQINNTNEEQKPDEQELLMRSQEPVQLFETEWQRATDQYASQLKAGVVFQLDRESVQELLNRNPRECTLNLPTGNRNEVFELQLERSHITARGFEVYTSDNRNIPFDYEGGLHFHGTVKGEDKSLVAVSVFEHEVMGLISTKKGTYTLGKIGGAETEHVLYRYDDLIDPPEFTCYTEDDGKGYAQEQLYTSPRDAGDCTNIYVEADKSLFDGLGSVEAVVNLMLGSFNQSAVLYENEMLTISVSEIFVWTTPDPYDGPTPGEYRAEFQANTGAFNGDLGHLVALDNVGGQAAGFDGICNSDTDESLCFSGFSGTGYNEVPTYSFNVYIITHEMGHLFGSRHTHACVWNGDSTAIDGCSGFTEGTCALPPSPPGGGTIMSYCHNDPVGIDFTQGFGPQPGNVIRNTIDNATCLSATCSVPVNDLCGDAVTLYCGGFIEGNTNSATDNDAPSGCTGGGSPNEGVWYVFTGNGDVFTISTADSEYDTQINIYSGSCGSLTCIGGDDDGGPGLTSSFTFCTVNGTDYYVYLDGFGGAIGDYKIALSCNPDVTSPSISCPGDITMNNDAGQCSAIINYPAATATDNCGVSSITYSQNSGTSFPVGTTVVTATAEDVNGNSSTCSFSITVNDNEAPTLTPACQNPWSVDDNSVCPADAVPNVSVGDVLGLPFTLDVGGNNTFTTYSGCFEDNCTPASDNQLRVNSIAYDDTNLPTERIITLQFDVGDDAGNWNTAAYTIEVNIEDVDPPVITSPPGVFDVTVELTDPNGSCPDEWSSISWSGGTTTLTMLDGSVHQFTANIQGMDCDPTLSIEGCHTSCGLVSYDGCTAVYESGWRLKDAGGLISSSTYIVRYTLVDAVEPTLTPACQNPWNISDNTVCPNTAQPNVAEGDVLSLPFSLDVGGNNTFTTNTGCFEDNCGAAGNNVLRVNNITYDDSNLPASRVITLDFDVGDACGNWNTSAYQINVTINDVDPPIVFCQNKVLQLNADGTAQLTPGMVNAGSYDECGPIQSMSVFPNVFDCGDVGAHIVTLTVEDIAGNTASCQSIVDVEDNVPPNVQCKTIYRSLNANDQVIIGPSDVDDGSTDACGIASMTVDKTTFDCDDLGPNAVVLTVTDVNGNSSTCEATVHILDNTPPLITCPPSDTIYADFNCPKAIPDYLDDIMVSDNCDSIYDTYQQPIPGTTLPPGVHDITMTVWDESLNAATCIVELTIIDQKDPVLSCPGPDTIQAMGCTAFLPDYRVQDSVSDNCQNYVPLSQSPSPGTELMPGTHVVTITATDDAGNTASCSLSVTVEGDTGPLGIVCPDNDTLSAGAGCQASLPDYTPDAMVTGNCGNGGTVSQSPVNGTAIPIGLHTLTLTATDNQGNTATCTMTVEVVDDQDPMVSCEDVTITLSPGEQYTLPPGQIDAGSSDNCGIDTTWLSQDNFTCADTGDQIVTLMVEDVNGNSSSCTATVTVECTQPTHSLSGTITNAWNTGVKDVSVNISGSESGTSTTNQSGDYSTTINNGANVTLTPEKDINYSEGVSTADLIQIQLHILNLVTLDMPEQLIAADASNNGQISTFDLVQLQLLIVGLSADLPNNTSWRFVRSDYVFPDPTDPWLESWPEDTTVTNVTSDLSGLDFTAIKIGDINGSYSPNLQGGTETENRRGDYTFAVQNRRLQADESIEVWFTLEEAEELMGYQSSLTFSTEALEFMEVVTAETLPGLNEDMFNTREAADGTLHFNYWRIPGQRINSGDKAFGLRFQVTRGTGDQRLSDLFSLTADRLRPEAYIGGAMHDLELRFIEAEEAAFVLYPNRPNPYREETIISFELPKAENATIQIMDVNGRMLIERDIDGKKGYNEWILNGGQLPEGVLYYRVATDEHTGVRKMILQR